MTTILIVDDEVDVRRYWSMALRESGYLVLEASDGVDGLHYARTKHPDLVISDLLMPTMGGFELARQIRTDPSTANIPVILITGIFQEEEGRRLAESCGVEQLLSKPCTGAKIIEVVANVLSTPSCQTSLAENVDREHLQILNNTLVAKVRELETVNERIRQQVAALERAGQALQDKDNALRHFFAIVECSDDAIISKNLAGTILSWNPAAERIYGYNAAEVIGHSISLLAPPDGVGEMQYVLEKLGRGERLAHHETVRRRKDGHLIHVSLTISPVQDSAGQVVAACTIARDITERKRAENELRESRERFELAVRGATDGVFDINTVTGETYVSDRWCWLLGYQRGELPEAAIVNQWVFAQIHPDDLDSVNDAVRRHWELREPYGVEFRLRNKSGEYRWFNSRGQAAWNLQGQVIRFAGCLTDITERRRAEAELRHTRDRLGAMLQALPDLLFEVDQSGRIIDYRARQENLLAVPPAHFLGKTLTEVLPLDAVGTCLEAIHEAADVGIGRSKPYRLVLADGEYWFELSVARKPKADNEASTFILLVREVTERKQAEILLQAERDRLRQILDSQFGFVCELTLDGVLVDVNQTPLTLMGLSRADVVGRRFWEVGWLEPGAEPKAQAAIEAVARGETVRGDIAARFPGLGRREVDAVFHPLRGVGGAVASVIGFGVDITERKRAEVALTESRNRLEYLSRKLIATQELERQTLARELHDEIGQTLTAMRLLCESGTCPAGPRLLGLVTELMGRVRYLSFDLRPPMLDPLGLLPTVLWKFEQYSEQTGIRVVFQHTGVERRFAPELEIAAYRIIQEALTNIARHAEVTEVTVELWADADSLGIQVTDRGKGFDPDAVMAGGKTGGLTGIQERVEFLHGVMAIESTPGEGTFLTVQFPIFSCSDDQREP